MKIKLFLLFIILISGCAVNKNHCLPLDTDDETVQYSKTEIYDQLYPYIAAQVMDTATSLYYFNNNAISNAVSDPNKEEVPGVCIDYATNFYQNYKGPGEVFIVSVYENGESELIKIKKKFEKNDLYTDYINTYINSCYLFLIEDVDESNIIFRYENKDFYPFYLIRIDNEIYWFQGKYDKNNKSVPSILFEEFHLKQNLNIDNLYSYIINEYNKGKKTYIYETHNLKFITDKNGLLLIESYPILTPTKHVSLENKEFYKHAWIRIFHNNVTIDVDPTYIECKGWDLNEIIEIIN